MFAGRGRSAWATTMWSTSCFAICSMPSSTAPLRPRPSPQITWAPWCSAHSATSSSSQATNVGNVADGTDHPGRHPARELCALSLVERADQPALGSAEPLHRERERPPALATTVEDACVGRGGQRIGGAGPVGVAVGPRHVQRPWIRCGHADHPQQAHALSARGRDHRGHGSSLEGVGVPRPVTSSRGTAIRNPSAGSSRPTIAGMFRPRRRRCGSAASTARPVTETRLRIPDGDAVQRGLVRRRRRRAHRHRDRERSSRPFAVALSGGGLLTERPPADVPVQGIELDASASCCRSVIGRACGWRSPTVAATPGRSRRRVPAVAAVVSGWLTVCERASRLGLPDQQLVEAVVAARCDLLLDGPVDPADPLGFLFDVAQLVRLGDGADAWLPEVIGPLERLGSRAWTAGRRRARSRSNGWR